MSNAKKLIKYQTNQFHLMSSLKDSMLVNLSCALELDSPTINYSLSGTTPKLLSTKVNSGKEQIADILSSKQLRPNSVIMIPNNQLS